MSSVMQQFRRAVLAASAVGLALGSAAAYAEGADTNFNTTIGNRATVSYSVNTVAQTPIESRPGAGNTTPGTGNGADTTFVVDRKVKFTVAEKNAAATPVVPGQNGAVTVWTVTNLTNGPVGFVFAAANQGGTVFTRPDAFDVSGITVYVDADNDEVADAGEAATGVLSVAEGGTVQVLVAANVALTVTNNQAAHVRLTAQATADGTATVLTQSAAADDPAVVESVFADAGNDNSEFADDSYWVQSAALTVAKTSSVISDGISASNPKSIPGATVEYAIAIANTGATEATGVAVSDPIPANTTFAGNVSYQIGAGAPTACVAETGGTDSNSDGCFVNGSNALQVAPGGGLTIPAASSATVRFRVTIN